MKRLQAYKFELKKPDAETCRDLRRFAGCRRAVYNKGLEACVAHYQEAGKHLGYNALAGMLVQWKRDPQFAWLREAPSHVLQQSLRDLDRAFGNFFRKNAKFPTFKKKSHGASFRFPDPKQFQLDQPSGRIKLPKLGWVRYRASRPILGTPKNVTVSCSVDKWFISVQTEREVEHTVHPATSAVGIDVGVARFATLSDGSHVAPANSFKCHEARLRRYQRAMSRKVKFSSNWKKAKVRVQRIHTRIGNVRRDFLHQASTILSNNHALIVVENLQVKSMSRSAAGTAELPGRNVRQKSGLNRAILDQGWSEFRRQLEYKQEWRNGLLLAVPAQYTSQTCPACSHVAAENRRTQAVFECVECGFAANADHVAAINILARGHRVLACGEMAPSGRSMKQEPTEVTTRGLALA